MIAIIDYNAGNIKSVEKAFTYLGFNAKITSNPNDLENASHLVLPGQGAFGDCITNLKKLKFYDIIIKNIEKGKPFLGICVGMQLLFEESTEFGIHKGFGFFKGKIDKFPNNFNGIKYKIPQMGWNQVKIVKNHPVLKGVTDESFFYFIHSYYAPITSETIGVTEYGIRFSSIVAKNNIIATQFHPEKSHNMGLKIIKNFGEWRC